MSHPTSLPAVSPGPTIPCLKVALMWKGSVYQASQYPCRVPTPQPPTRENWEGPHRIGRGSQPLGVADVPQSWIPVVLLNFG